MIKRLWNEYKLYAGRHRQRRERKRNIAALAKSLNEVTKYMSTLVRNDLNY